MTTNASSTWLVDRVRARLYLAARPALGSLYADRAKRVAWVGVLSVVVSFALTLVAPLWLLALGPVLLGVPHLIADARYLVVQPKLVDRGPVVWAAALPLIATGFGAPPAFSMLVMVPALLAAEGTLVRRLMGLIVWLALTIAALQWETAFLFAFLHAHNLIALGWWWVLRPRTAMAWWVPALVLMGTALLLTGAMEPLVMWGAPSTATSLEDFVLSSASFASDSVAPRVVLSFAFLQSVHYAMWLRLVPEDARRRPAPRPFRESWRALVSDFGVPLLVVFGALTLFIAGWGLVSLSQARLGYLQLAAFHGYLELGAAAFFFIEGRRLPC